MSEQAEFERQYGDEPTLAAVSPGRINLIGEHIDYLGGSVLPIAIERHMTFLARPVDGDVCRIWPVGLGLDAPAEIDLRNLVRRKNSSENWVNYIIGVLAGYRDAGVKLPAFDGAIFSSLPTGAGLSSSAALETATALVVESASGVGQDVVDRALLCQRAEHEFAGVPCGIMDQLAVGACREGHAMLLDCGDHSRKHFRVPEGLTILVSDTGVKHALGDGEYRRRREDCEEASRILQVDSLCDATLPDLEVAKDVLGPRLFARARHAVTESKRVLEFAAALEWNDMETLGRTMREGHESLKMDYEVSCEELDVLVDAAYDFGSGLVGSRMTGGGFGGSTVSLVRSESAESLKSHLENTYQEKFGRSLNCFITSAASGARLVSPPLDPSSP